MNSVHFPKLEEYAIEPILVKEPSSYGNFGTPSSGKLSSSQSENKPRKVDSFSKSTGSAYFQRTATSREHDKTRLEGNSPKTQGESADTEYSKRNDHHKTFRRQVAIDQEESAHFLPPLQAGKTSLVSNNILEHGDVHSHDISQRRFSKETKDTTSKKNAPKTYQRPTAANAFGDGNSQEEIQTDTFTNNLAAEEESYSPKEEEDYETAVRSLRKARKLSKGTNRVQSHFIDGSLWDYEVTPTPKKRDHRDSLHLPSLSLKSSLTTRNDASFQDTIKTRDRYISVSRENEQAEDFDSENKFYSRFPNGYNNSRSRRSLWRVGLHMRKLLPKRNQLERFRRLTIGIVNVLKLAKAIIKPTDSPSALLKNFTAMSKQPEKKEDASDHMKSYGLEFNASYFRANKEISISSEVKNFLRLPPNRRTPEQIQTIIFGLQSLPSFAEYPLHMQEKLAKVAWYEIVTPMRTIIRQSHFAENFYFILSGQALVTIHKPGDATPKTAGMMRKGTSFGELALLHHSRRTATVTSHDTVQLLSVGREDFFDIFMAGHGTEQIPEHIKFISQLDFMKDWPLERLLERPDQCLLHFFKRNMVILKASEVSEWFYVVKSGTCQVLKQLKGVTGRLGQLVSSRHASHDKGEKLRSGASFQDSRLNTERRPTKKNVSADNIIEQVKALKHSSRESKNSTDRLQPCSEEEQEEHPNHTTRNRVQRMSNRRPLQHGQSFSKLSIGPPHFRTTKSMDCETKDKRKHRSNGSFCYHRRQRREQQQQQTQQQQQQHEAPPVFVQIELLKPRDVFGLDMISFNSADFQRSTVSLVSLGAECIMLSKAFFLKHANDRVKKRFSEIVQPYPDERSLQASLQNKADWELYKHSLLSTITAPKPTGLRGAPLTSHH